MHYRQIVALKRKYPNVKILLSVGGGHDHEHNDVYLSLLESSTGRMAYINSAYTLIKEYGFDGLDLSWQFPTVRPVKIKGAIKSFWNKLKETVGVTKGPVDEKSDEHKEEFTSLVRELKNAFRHDGYQLSLTVLPNVNSTLYFDINNIINNLDFISISAFDFQTPDRNPKLADYSSPIYSPNERDPEFNINYQVTHWLGYHTPAYKLIVGIPTFGRAWKLIADSGTTGYPPLTSDGVAPEGQQTKKAGLLSWPEVCSKLPNPSNQQQTGENKPLTKVLDPTKRFGSYAYRIPDSDENYGVWVSYIDPDSASSIAGYVKAKGLGGIGIFDLSLDDFKGTCSGDKYPLLRAAKYRL